MGPSVPEEASVFEDRRGSGWDRRCVKQQKRLQKQTFSNQRPNALDSANLAPAVSARGRPHTDLGEWKNSVSPRNLRREYNCSEDERSQYLKQSMGTADISTG